MMKLMQSSEAINSNSGFSLVQELLDGNARMKDWDADLLAGPSRSLSLSALLRMNANHGGPNIWTRL